VLQASNTLLLCAIWLRQTERPLQQFSTVWRWAPKAYAGPSYGSAGAVWRWIRNRWSEFAIITGELQFADVTAYIARGELSPSIPPRRAFVGASMVDGHSSVWPMPIQSFFYVSSLTCGGMFRILSHIRYVPLSTFPP